MATFTLKNVPDELLDRVRAAAEVRHRSMNGEILACLERAFGAAAPLDESIARARQLRAAFKGRPISLVDLQKARAAGRQ